MKPTVMKPELSPVPSLMKPRHFLTATIFIVIIVLGVRIDDVVRSAINGNSSSVAHAAATEHKAAETPASASTETPVAKESAAPSLANDGVDETLDPSIIAQLKQRRDQLDQRIQEVESKEALLQIAEQRVDKKIKELEALRAQIQSLVGQANANQAAQIENLVRIYETMKAKEAARIFEALDMPTLLNVIERMKPGRVAVIMAEMNPEKAKEITVALTRRDQIPTK